MPTTTTNNNPFEGLTFTDGKNDNTKKMGSNQVLVFVCTKKINNVDYYTYYCYFKDGESIPNAWLIYITNTSALPVVFDIQDDLEPIFSGVTSGEPSTFSVSMINTGNFILQKGDDGYFTYASLQLKNTSFNLGIDEKTETTVGVEPVGVFTITN